MLGSPGLALKSHCECVPNPLLSVFTEVAYKWYSGRTYTSETGRNNRAGPLSVLREAAHQHASASHPRERKFCAGAHTPQHAAQGVIFRSLDGLGLANACFLKVFLPSNVLMF